MDQPQNDTRPGYKARLQFWLIRILVALGCGMVLAVVGVAGMLLYYNFSLPAFDSLADYQPPQVTRMVDRQGRVVAELFDEKRTLVTLERVPLHVRNAFLAAEDADFYRHPGLDFSGMLRALWHNLRSGRVVEGGSTITQQVIKTLVLGPERSYARKIREALLALRLESNLTKDGILSLYLNQIFFGHRCYGVQEASRFYFDKEVEQLNLAEGSLLASLPKSPTLYSPLKQPQRARERRDWVLDQMLKNQMASSEDVARAKEEELKVVGKAADFFSLAPYYAEHCRRLLEERLGREALYRGGLRVELALDLDLQRSAQAAIEQGLREVDQRQGYRAPLGRLSTDELQALQEKRPAQASRHAIWTLWLEDRLTEPGPGDQPVGRPRVGWRELREGARVVVPVVAILGSGKAAVARLDLGSLGAELGLSQVQWARKFSPLVQTPKPKSVDEVLAVGDLVEIQIQKIKPDGVEIHLSQPPLVQGSLLAVDPSNRHVLAMVGGSDFRRSPLVRPVQSKRQPGSAFKPMVYATALHTGAYTPATIVMDSPEVYYASLRGSSWKPQNFERVFVGAVPVRYALAHSINSIAVKLGSDIGPDAIISIAHSLGIESELQRNLSLALGTSEVTLLELVNAYTTFAASGMVDDPLFIQSVIGPDGRQLELPERKGPRRAISAAEAFVMTSLLRSVIQEGTGKAALRLDYPLAGKTGTADQQRDGWFVGYSPDLVAGVWVGFDDHARMGSGWAQGAGTALPIWIRFMEQALGSRPRTDFKVPDGVVFVRVDPKNGLLASSELSEAKFEVFVEGTEPRSISSRSAGEASSTTTGNRSGLSPLSGERLPEGLFR